VRALLPEGEMATLYTEFLCPAYASTTAPFWSFHSNTAFPLVPHRKRSSSGKNATLSATSLPGTVITFSLSPLLTSHRRIVPSSLQLRTRLPSLEKATPLTAAV